MDRSPRAKAVPGRPWRARLLLTSLALTLSGACGDCSCSKVTPPGTEAPLEGSASYLEIPYEEIEGRMMAIVRIQELALVEGVTKKFISPKGDEDRAKLETELSFYQILQDHLGAEALKGLRRDGNVDFGWLRKESASEIQAATALSAMDPDWFIVLPVTSREEFFARPEVEQIDREFARYNTPSGPLWLSKKEIELARGISSDKGERVILASSAPAATHAAELLNRHGREQRLDIQLTLWPSHTGLTTRWRGFYQELTQRLSASGHGLLPARAGMVNLELMATRALSRGDNWPEPMHMHFEFKVKGGEPRLLRATTYVDTTREEAHVLRGLYEALQPRKGGYPPVPRAPGEATISLRLDRSEIDDTFDLIFPAEARNMMAARGEESMASMRGVLSDLLDHDRGATTLSFYPQTHPLSAETYFAFEASDLEQLEAHAKLWNESLVHNLWAPLHLTAREDISGVESVTLTPPDKDGAPGKSLTAHRMTFEVSASSGPVDLGACWTIFDGQYISYMGEKPCEKLEAQLDVKPTAQPAPLGIDVEATDLLDLFYLPPGRKLTTPLGEGKHRIKINGYARPFEGKEQLILETQFADAALIRDVLNELDVLGKLWNPNSELELTDILQRASLEQALYQEPALSFIAAPGLPTGAPPSMFFGLPFSLPPAPPHQLEEALTGVKPGPNSESTPPQSPSK